MSPAGAVEIVLGDDTWVLEPGPDGWIVRNEAGTVLDADAAAALIALGGPEPWWLRAVEALAAAAGAGAGPGDLARVGRLLGSRWSAGDTVARGTTEPILMLALAAAGHDAVADNPACTPEAWEALAGHRDPAVGKRAWGRERLAPTLAGHPDPQVRARVGTNPDCDEATLDRLASDPEPMVRVRVAANEAAGRSALVGLTRDLDQRVVRVAAANHSTPPERLARLARRARPPAVRATATANPSLPARRAARGVWDASAAVRLELAKRHDIPAATLVWVERYARGDTPAQYRAVAERILAHPFRPAALMERICRAEPSLATSLGRPLLEEPPRAPAVLSAAKRRAAQVAAVLAIWVGFCLLLAAPFLILASLQGIAHGAAVSPELGVLGLGLIDAAFLAALFRWARRRGRRRLSWVRPPRPREALGLLVVLGLVVATSPRSGTISLAEIGLVYVLGRMANRGRLPARRRGGARLVPRPGGAVR